MKRTHRKRRSTWIDITFSFAIIALTVSAIYLISLNNQKRGCRFTLTRNKLPPDSSSDRHDSIPSYPGIKIITETSNDTYSCHSPSNIRKVYIVPFNEAISNYISYTKQSLFNYYGKNMKKLSDTFKGELNISFETLVTSFR